MPWKSVTNNHTVQTIINRLRLRLTHSYLLINSDPPRYKECDVIVIQAVIHLLLDCPQFNMHRITYKISNDRSVLLRKNCPWKDIAHLKTIQLLHKI